MENIFSKKLTFSQFLKFVMPAIISMVFISIYTIVDGIFVSNFVGSDALASINIVLPLINLVFGFAVMIGTGGSAVIAIKLGEKKIEESRNTFSALMIFSFVFSLILGLILCFFMKDISYLLGATDRLIDYSITYGVIIAFFTPVFVIKSLVEFFIRTDGDFKFSLFISIIGGVINIVLDYVFIVIFGYGIGGAALATGLGALISLLIGLLYFRREKSTLKFVKPKFDFRIIKDVCINGSSEMVTELSTGITTLLFNYLALKYAGEDGVAALTIILYAHFLLISTYLGFSAGVSPIISYNYGARNYKKLKEVLKYSKYFLAISSVFIFIFSITFAKGIVQVFVDPSNNTYSLALKGLYIFSFAFLAVGFNVFASGLFTSLSNGKISAIISFARAFLFVIIGALIFPALFEIDGLWLIVPFAEFLTLLIDIFFIKEYKDFYHLEF
ncbi:MAG: MATE family efflux transporter [Clostridium chrysemydis]|uniref:MATE family efflux transporter n=1 Tax=Clostridium TaxID=1485 RepID=UPI0021530633|nr:MATE family efflux transporter [Clostridium sp. LY3-2]MCR6515501.1 MATE family efflux transporter [Clostridium sp. LY3-2]